MALNSEELGSEEVESVDELAEDELMHYGILRRSGRYPWGSGLNPYQRSVMFQGWITDVKNKHPGISEAKIVDILKKEYPELKGFSTTDLRTTKANATEEIFAQNQSMAYRLKQKGMSNTAIAKQMGVNESTVRGWLSKPEGIQEGSIRATANTLKEEMKTKPYLDVGTGSWLWLGVNETKLKAAVARLRDEGYELHIVKAPQLGGGPDQMTSVKVLCPPGTTAKEAYEHRGEIQNVTSHSVDGGQTFYTPDPRPKSISSDRVAIRYGEDGGDAMDGVIELRRGVPDLDLGANNYSQVRVAVDDTHYMKGMAIYTDDLPKGVDIRYNTPKSKSEAPNKSDVFKKMESDPDNPFGSSTYPKMYTGKDGKEHQSILNVVGSKGKGNEEGRWDEWSKTLSSQFLSKQPLSLASQQLSKTQENYQKDLQEISNLTNPVVRKILLDDFADRADSAASHLKAAHLPGQATRVLLPMNSMRPTEVYAPGFEHGSKVALVRFPHGGPFEIPELTVNNRSTPAKRAAGDWQDAVGVHYTVAAQLSGADFDGDSVVVIPNNDGKIRARSPLAELKNFDPKASYPPTENSKRMESGNVQREMGQISNLITDMTIHGASDSELARAVRHSMVVIDAKKHGLNYKLSAQENGIASLKEEYQGSKKGGASTIISRASAEARVPKFRETIDPNTGKRVRTTIAEPYPAPTKSDPDRVKYPTQSLTKMDTVDDAAKLMSTRQQPIEKLYASHANSLKDMANRARKESVNTKSPKASPAAKAVYAKEVESLNKKLQVAQRNAPLERQAQVIGNAQADARIKANPALDKDDIKKIKYQELARARVATGANKSRIQITEREWEAIQSRAVAPTRLATILRNSDMDQVKQLATPRSRSSLTPGQIARAKAMAAQGRPMTDISESLGIPRSTLIDNINR